MIRQRLPFSDRTIEVQLPERTRLVATRQSQGRIAPLADEGAAVRHALARPLGMPPVGALVRPSSRVVIAFDDPTVPSYGPIRQLAVCAVLDELNAAGVDQSQVTMICANALHRKWTSDELAAGLGEDLVRRFGDRLICHDAEDAQQIINLGTTPEGYDVEVHRLVAECDLTVYVNAGYHLGVLFGRIKQRKISFPRKQDVGNFLDEFGCEKTKYDPEQRAIKYSHDGTHHDDALHAANYGLLLATRSFHAANQYCPAYDEGVD